MNKWSFATTSREEKRAPRSARLDYKELSNSGRRKLRKETGKTVNKVAIEEDFVEEQGETEIRREEVFGGEGESEEEKGEQERNREELNLKLLNMSNIAKLTAELNSYAFQIEESMEEQKRNNNATELAALHDDLKEQRIMYQKIYSELVIVDETFEEQFKDKVRNLLKESRNVLNQIKDDISHKKEQNEKMNDAKEALQND